MSDTLQAHDRQPITSSDQQESTQVNNGKQSSDKSFPTSGADAPFYSQLGPFSQASHTPSSQHGNLYADHQHQQFTHGLDMSTIGYALPGSATLPASLRGFPQQAPSLTDGASAQPSGMNFGSQLHHYGSQAYPSNMTMQMPVQHAQVHLSPSAPQYYYSGYNAPALQASMQQQGQLTVGYPTMPGMPYNRSESNNRSNQPVSYLSTLKILDRSLSARDLC